MIFDHIQARLDGILMDLEHEKRMDKMNGRELSKEEADAKWHFLFDPWVNEVVKLVEEKTSKGSSYFCSRFCTEVIQRLEAMRDGAESANEWD